MSVGRRKPMSLEEFLAWEERQELRYEFDGLRPIAMTGGSSAHARVQRNLAISIGGRRFPISRLAADQSKHSRSADSDP